MVLPQLLELRLCRRELVPCLDARLVDLLRAAAIAYGAGDGRALIGGIVDPVAVAVERGGRFGQLNVVEARRVPAAVNAQIAAELNLTDVRENVKELLPGRRFLFVRPG